jgi:hypothetical protein
VRCDVTWCNFFCLYIFRLWLEWWLGARGVLEALSYIPGENGKIIIF